MNKELIKKYKQEFEYWLNGGKLQAKFVYDEWVEAPKDIFSYNMVNFVLVIDDEYIEFRKALAEGKVIEFKHPQVGFEKWKIVTPEHLFQSVVPGREYRIKPEEPKFKVGDWVRDKTSKQRIIKKVTSVYSDSATVGDSTAGINVMLVKDLELWKPQPGEWCWFWDDNLTKPQLSKFKGIIELYDRGFKYSYFSPIEGRFMNGQVGTQNCEPFIGQLPTILKDSE